VPAPTHIERCRIKDDDVSGCTKRHRTLISIIQKLYSNLRLPALASFNLVTSYRRTEVLGQLIVSVARMREVRGTCIYLDNCEQFIAPQPASPLELDLSWTVGLSAPTTSSRNAGKRIYVTNICSRPALLDSVGTIPWSPRGGARRT
jgi:hypothetical protein